MPNAATLGFLLLLSERLKELDAFAAEGVDAREAVQALTPSHSMGAPHSVCSAEEVELGSRRAWFRSRP